MNADTPADRAESGVARSATAFLSLLEQFLTRHPDRPCGWPILTVSPDGTRHWRYGGP